MNLWNITPSVNLLNITPSVNLWNITPSVNLLNNTVSMNLWNNTPMGLLDGTNLSAVPEGCMVVNVAAMGFIPWDNPDNIVSQHTEKVVDAVVGTMCLPVLFLIAAPCNLLNMLVFRNQGLKERINLCLFFLSLADFVHMLTNFLFNVERIIRTAPFTLAVSTEEIGAVKGFILEHFLVGLLHGFGWLSGFTSMLIAIERCVCVVSPLRSQTFLKTKTTALILATASVLILTGAMVAGLRRSLRCVFDPETNTTSRVIFTSELYARNKGLNVLSFFVATLQLFVYALVVSATTVVTSVKLRQMVAWRKQTSSSALSSREVALTRMLIAVSALYVVCCVPIIVLGIGVMFVPGLSFSGRYYNFSNLLVSLVELASFINATFNFFVYAVLGSKFKDTLCKLLCCKTATPVFKGNSATSVVQTERS